MFVKRFINDFFESNSYVIEFDTNEIILIDPADNDFLFEYLDRKNFCSGFILLTHEHIDHISGTNFLKNKYPDINIVATLACAKAIIDPKKNLSLFYGKSYFSKPADTVLEQNQSLTTPNFQIKFYPFGGHSPGGALIFIGDVLFVGDQFIKKLKTVTKLPGGSKSELIDSYNFIKKNFDPKIIIYPGHGENFTVNELELW